MAWKVKSAWTVCRPATCYGLLAALCLQRCSVGCTHSAPWLVGCRPSKKKASSSGISSLLVLLGYLHGAVYGRYTLDTVIALLNRPHERGSHCRQHGLHWQLAGTAQADKRRRSLRGAPPSAYKPLTSTCGQITTDAGICESLAWHKGGEASSHKRPGKVCGKTRCVTHPEPRLLRQHQWVGCRPETQHRLVVVLQRGAAQLGVRGHLGHPFACRAPIMHNWDSNASASSVKRGHGRW